MGGPLGWIGGMPVEALAASPPPNPNLPPHLREVCDILARGLLRLRSRAAAPEAPTPANTGEFRLHFTAHQRSHVTPKRKGTA